MEDSTIFGEGRGPSPEPGISKVPIEQPPSPTLNGGNLYAAETAGNSPVEIVPDGWQDAKYLEAICKPYPSNIPRRHQEREEKIGRLIYSLQWMPVGVGGKMIVTSSIGGWNLPTKILLPDERLTRAARFVQQWHNSEISPSVLSEPCVDLEVPPDIPMALAGTALQGMSQSREIPSWMRRFSADWQRFERLRSDGVASLGECYELYITAPKLTVPSVYGPIHADESFIADDNPHQRRLFQNYLVSIGYRRDFDKKGYRGSVTEVLGEVLKAETDASLLDEYLEMIKELQKHSATIASHSRQAMPSEYKAHWVKGKPAIQEQRQARQKLMEPVQHLMNQVVRLGFESYARRSWLPIDTSRLASPNGALLDINNFSARPDDKEPDVVTELWHNRSARFIEIEQSQARADTDEVAKREVARQAFRKLDDELMYL